MRTHHFKIDIFEDHIVVGDDPVQELKDLLTDALANDGLINRLNCTIEYAGHTDEPEPCQPPYPFKDTFEYFALKRYAKAYGLRQKESPLDFSWHLTVLRKLRRGAEGDLEAGTTALLALGNMYRNAL